MKKYTEEELKYFDWLERLRQSGVTNMFGAAPYLVRAFTLDQKTAREILAKWMRNYDELQELRGWKR